MAKFELKLYRGTSYDNQIELDIRLTIKPSAEDSKSILAAIDTLDSFANKYLKLVQTSIIKPAKEAK